MKLSLSCFAFLALAVASALCAPDARALDMTHPHGVHRSRTVQPRTVAKRHGGASTAHAASSHATTKAKATATRVTGARATRATARTTTAHGRVRAASGLRRRHAIYERFTAASFVTTAQGEGDITAGEDPTIRAAALDALGNMNGTVVVINPANGRILAMVNQKLALSPGAEPCSTIKLSVGLAALSEGLITRDTMLNLGGWRMNLTEALAHSNNVYFETLGRELGFARVRHYATEFGLGELAGWNISGEQLGTYPDHELPASEGGVGRMCSFGQGVSMTPLQLGALVAAIANGGTLYYLQHPNSPGEVADFQPKVKRTLSIAKYIPDMQDGMAGAVEYGTARSLRVNFHELPVFGKTGTCSNAGTRYGWFASYSDSPMGPLVSVFFLEGGRAVFGPRAAELTGLFYRSLWDRNYFTGKPAAIQANASVGAASLASGMAVRH
ncbi:MAG TPA: penicillin-binding transpeptidase domain-containing protein [Acidobacteriaceae bacterium]|nr:penicillin-binding transpeptidase domain-containing protein [Acidobacteriaceae bacterium]